MIKLSTLRKPIRIPFSDFLDYIDSEPVQVLHDECIHLTYARRGSHDGEIQFEFQGEPPLEFTAKEDGFAEINRAGEVTLFESKESSPSCLHLKLLGRDSADGSFILPVKYWQVIGEVDVACYIAGSIETALKQFSMDAERNGRPQDVLYVSHSETEMILVAHTSTTPVQAHEE